MTTTPEPEGTSETEGTTPAETEGTTSSQTPGTVPVRLDRALVDRGLARSRGQAAELIKAGRVSLDGRTVLKPSDLVAGTEQLEARTDPYVSRGAHKLAGALDDLGLVPSGRALDAGSSTGGFTQVLLERGVRQVLAVDVGHGQLDPIVAKDDRVVAVEGFNLRFATPETLGGASGVHDTVELVVGDLSFISLGIVLPALQSVATPDADFVLLVKPQFEVGRTGVKEGIVRNAALRADAVSNVLWAAYDLGLSTAGMIASPIAGSAGNQEYLVWFNREVGSHPTEWLHRVTEMTGA